MLIDRIQQIVASIIVSPIVLDITTGTPQVFTEISDNQFKLNIVSMVVTAITSIVTTVLVAYFQAKFKSKND